MHHILSQISLHHHAHTQEYTQKKIVLKIQGKIHDDLASIYIDIYYYAFPIYQYQIYFEDTHTHTQTKATPHAI